MMGGLNSNLMKSIFNYFQVLNLRIVFMSGQSLRRRSLAKGETPRSDWDTGVVSAVGTSMPKSARVLMSKGRGRALGGVPSAPAGVAPVRIGGDGWRSDIVQCHTIPRHTPNPGTRKTCVVVDPGRVLKFLRKNLLVRSSRIDRIWSRRLEFPSPYNWVTLGSTIL
ncbi:hypothetical protein TIFTF001_008074 [Ficus carica]|uniref:Uncharacterized protein n=1 Tax=Ficus carica TaxID=3494 RepID=A0AA88AEF5_FICCA|nr:hypothetical protein TIFTF001_008074 [Ficus carica]